MSQVAIDQANQGMVLDGDVMDRKAGCYYALKQVLAR